jgi:exodeoxyribonuclease VII large subunit
VVARAIYASNIPIISAVGHETDVTISDFVADVRAETPTAAAVLAVPDTKELRTYLDFLDSKLQENLQYWVDKKNERLSRLDLSAFRKGILDRIELLSLRNQKHKEQMYQQIEKHVERLSTQITKSHMVLEHLNPKSIMGRGYAALTTADGVLVTSTESLQVDDPISVILRDGKLETRITKIERE